MIKKSLRAENPKMADVRSESDGAFCNTTLVLDMGLNRGGDVLLGVEICAAFSKLWEWQNVIAFSATTAHLLFLIPFSMGPAYIELEQVSDEMKIIFSCTEVAVPCRQRHSSDVQLIMRLWCIVCRHWRSFAVSLRCWEGRSEGCSAPDACMASLNSEVATCISSMSSL